jgi:hypothetical protein
VQGGELEMDSSAVREIKEIVERYGLKRRELLRILSIIERDVWMNLKKDNYKQ